MHTSRNDYLINTLRFASAKETTQIYGAILPESLTSPKMKETKAFKTYLGYATGATPPKKARRFKKPASPQLTTVPVSPEEPTGKSKRVKRPAKKSTKAPARGVVIRETPEMKLSKKKEKVDVTRGKEIELLSEVALTEDAQFKEVRRKSMRDFHKTYPSGYGTITKTAPSAAKIKPSGNDKDDSNNEQDSSGEDSDQENDSDDDKTQTDDENESDFDHKTDENESDSESNQEENEEDIGDDEEEVKDEFFKTPSNDSDAEDETKITDKAEGDEDEEMDYTTSQLYDDVDIRLNEPVDTNKGFIQEEGTDAELTNTLEKEVVKLKKDDPLKTQVTALVDEHLDARLGATRDEFVNFLLASITTNITEQVKNQLPQILPKEVSNFAPLMIQSMVTESLEHVVLAKESSQPQSSYEAAATLIEFELKKILIDIIDKSKSYLAAPEHRESYKGLRKSYDLDKTIFSTYGKVYSLKRSRKDKDKHEDPFAGTNRGLKKWKTSKEAEPTKGSKAKESQSGSSKGDKSQSKSSKKYVQSEEPEFEVADLDMPQDQEENPGNDDEEPKEKDASKCDCWLMTLASSADKPSKTFDELMSTPIDYSAYIMNGLKITNLTQETLLGLAFRLLKGTRSNCAELEYDFEEFMSGNRQKVPVDYFFNIDLKYFQGGVSTMTYTNSITKTKAAQYDLPGIKDMVEVMRKHGYGYLKEIVVRRADNGLYRFKKGDFLRLCINDIEDMFLLVVQNRLINLSGDDVSDFAIALRMFTESLVIQKRVEDLQLRVKSYQKKINVTKP
ncbi:hypothetical protein Tco_0425218 [Tanacetum coccineum]